MSEPGSVTELLLQLQTGEANEAQHELVKRYFGRLAAVARTKLSASVRRSADEEDIALSTLNSFFLAAEQGRYPNLQDRHGLWPLLLRIAACKAVNYTQREFAEKRGGRNVRGDSALDHRSLTIGFDALATAEPTPDSVVALRELMSDLMARLESDMLRSIARLRLAGYSNREIADQLKCVERTVERKLARIRHNWSFLIEGQK